MFFHINNLIPPTEKKRACLISLSIFILFSFITQQHVFAQSKHSVFQTGERLEYKVKYGFVKLGTLVIETQGPQEGNRIKARMKFWTAQVPFLNSKDIVSDVIDTSAICLMNFDEHGYDGEKK